MDQELHLTEAGLKERLEEVIPSGMVRYEPDGEIYSGGVFTLPLLGVEIILHPPHSDLVGDEWLVAAEPSHDDFAWLSTETAFLFGVLTEGRLQALAWLHRVWAPHTPENELLARRAHQDLRAGVQVTTWGCGFEEGEITILNPLWFDEEIEFRNLISPYLPPPLKDLIVAIQKCVPLGGWRVKCDITSWHRCHQANDGHINTPDPRPSMRYERATQTWRVWRPPFDISMDLKAKMEIEVPVADLTYTEVHERSVSVEDDGDDETGEMVELETRHYHVQWRLSAAQETRIKDGLQRAAKALHDMIHRLAALFEEVSATVVELIDEFPWAEINQATVRAWAIQGFAAEQWDRARLKSTTTFIREAMEIGLRLKARLGDDGMKHLNLTREINVRSPPTSPTREKVMEVVVKPMTVASLYADRHRLRAEVTDLSSSFDNQALHEALEGTELDPRRDFPPFTYINPRKS